MRWVRPRSMRSHSGGRDQPRQQIVGKDALGALVAAVDGEGDALGEKREVGRLLAPLQLLFGQPRQGLGQRAIVGAHLSARLAHLVECPIERIVSEKRIHFQWMAGAHEGLQLSLQGIQAGDRIAACKRLSYLNPFSSF